MFLIASDMTEISCVWFALTRRGTRQCASELNCMEAPACSNQAKLIAAEVARLFLRTAQSYKGSGYLWLLPRMRDLSPMQSGRTRAFPAVFPIASDMTEIPCVWFALTRRGTRQCASGLNCMEAPACSNQAKLIAAEVARLFLRTAQSYKGSGYLWLLPRMRDLSPMQSGRTRAFPAVFPIASDMTEIPCVWFALTRRGTRQCASELNCMEAPFTHRGWG